MDLETGLEYAGNNNQSVLTTLRNDGKPQISSVVHHLGDDGVIRISITATRAKYKNLQRRPWAALHINGDTFWSYAVVEADTTLSEVSAEPGDAAVDELVALYRHLQGEHPDWDDYRQAMVKEQRVVARLHPTRAYGMVRLPAPPTVKN